MMNQHTPEPARGEGRLVVVSNRLPFTLKHKEGDAGEGASGSWQTQRSTGGLATAMGPLLKKTGGLWIGWPGHSMEPSAPQDSGRRHVLEQWAREEGYHTVELSEKLVKGFYEGFSNETLWPLFHHFPFLLKFNPEHWEAYVEANCRFCEVVLKHHRPGDLVWVHDYQLMLLPRMLRAVEPRARVGFFLHIPFPPSGVFRLLPRGDELIDGLLGADYLAFHTHGDVQNFRTCVLRHMGLAVGIEEVQLGGRTVRMEALPIGIDPENYARLLTEDAETSRRITELQTRLAGRKLLVAVDRLDYTKGIPERLRAYNRLLKEHAHLRNQVVLVQVAVPSREGIETYQELGQETDELVGHINGEFGTPDWTPVVYMRRGMPPSELAALYACGDVGWVTPLRDGMNLVAKEYVSCQRGKGGVLVLSEFAGAATDLPGALRVNPYDEVRSAEAVARALTLPEAERRRRMASLYDRVSRGNVFAWGEQFLEGLRRAGAAGAGMERAERPPELAGEALDELVATYRRAKSRLLLLDYDGTLVGYASRPEQAVPVAGLTELLAALARDPANSLVVISGRGRADLDQWFGGIEGLWLAAEHGAVVRPAGSGASPAQWQAHRLAGTPEWKQHVRRVLEHFVDRATGSFIEEKEFSLVWHFRTADDPDFAHWLSNEVLVTLERGLANTELRAVRGRKSIEVKLAWANKGEVLARLESVPQSPDFLLAAGDDRTDEDLFARLPPDARRVWTIHVGDQASRARYRLRDSSGMLDLLKRLA
jgi:trehalose 6-phosphate synthase/phosphatase